MPKQYSIKWIIDDAMARAAFTRGTKGLKDLEAQALKTATAIETALNKAGQLAVTAQAKITVAAVQGASKRKQVADEEAAHIDVGLHKLQVSGVRFQEQLTRGTQRESDKRRKLLDAEARYQESQALGPNGRLAQVKRRALTEEEMQMAARNRAWDAHHQKRIRQILEEKYDTKSAFEDAIMSATGLGSAMTVAGGALMAFQGGKALLGGLADAFRNAKQEGISMAKSVQDTLLSLREIAALKDKYAPDMDVLQQHIDIRKASGLTQEEAIGLEEQLSDTMGTVSTQKITPAERQKIAQETARMAARSGGGARVKPIAEMVGVVSDLIKPGANGQVSSGQVMQMADAVNEINKLGSADERTSTTQAIKLMTALTAPGMVGAFQDPRRAVALSTIASKFAKEDSGTAALEAVRAVRGFTKFRTGKGQVTSQAQFLKDAGITEQMDPAQQMERLFKHAEKDMGKGEAFDAYLKRHGMRDETAAMRLSQFYGEYQRGNFGRLMGAASAPLTDEYKTRNAAFLQSQVGRDLLSRVAIDAARIDRGKKGVELNIAAQDAEATLIREGVDDSKMGQWQQFLIGMMGGFWGAPTGSGRQAMIETEAVRQARKRAGLAPGSGLGRFGESARTAALAQGPLGIFMGNTLGMATSHAIDDRREEVQRLREIAENTRRAAGGPSPDPIPVVPPPSHPMR